MEIPTKRIELEDGSWAEVYAEELRITARLHQAEMRKCMVPVDDGIFTDGKVLVSALERMATVPKPEFYVDYSRLDNDAINEIFILHQVKAWSFGEVDKDTLDYRVTSAQYKALVREMDALYQPVPLPGAGS